MCWMCLLRKSDSARRVVPHATFSIFAESVLSSELSEGIMILFVADKKAVGIDPCFYTLYLGPICDPAGPSLQGNNMFNHAEHSQ